MLQSRFPLDRWSGMELGFAFRDEGPEINWRISGSLG